MTHSIVPATRELVEELLLDLRETDRAEFLLSRLSNEEFLNDALKARSWVGLGDGKPVCFWGVTLQETPLVPPYVWMISSRHAEKFTLTFARHSVRIVRELLKEYGSLEGFVLESNKRSQRWLSWIGAKIGPVVDLYPVGEVRRFQLWL